MATMGGEHVYATLLLSDSYLPGALVLAHSLRDAQTTKKLAVLVTLDFVSADAITQLKAVYDYVLPVPRIRNEKPSNLYLMNRADLHSAFTKITLWKQTQFSKIVYIDADVVAYRAPDELFELSQPFAAAPDIGWPDLFNSGVMALTPNMGDYYAMMAMAERGISFDGADQGLLNMHFKNSYHRLSFTYNVTPSAHYQYIPAYRHFQSSINMVHFIGANKPWFAGRNAPHGASPFDEMVGRWWAVYDRHYRKHETTSAYNQSHQPQQRNAFVQYFTKGEFQPQAPTLGTGESQGRPSQAQSVDSHDFARAQLDPSGTPNVSQSDTQSGPHHHHHQVLHQQQVHVHSPEQRPKPPPIAMASWDAQRQPPPADSKPEAANFPSTQYTMSRDATPFVPPERYPSPPKDMWYEVPKEPPTPSQPKQVFPWEAHQPRASRSFAKSPSEKTPEAGALSLDTHASNSSSTVTESSTPTTPTVRVHPPPADSFSTFQLNNAWDEMPEINRYVEGLQKHRRGRSLGSTVEVSSPSGISSPSGGTRKPRGFKLTDFPSELERPSLPVTPAPITRPSFWGTEGEDSTTGAQASDQNNEALPAAEGVPGQSEWNPEAQLQKLAKQQYEHMLRKLGSGDKREAGSGPHVIPKRHLPFGSENATSPTYIHQGPAPAISSSQPMPIERVTIAETTAPARPKERPSHGLARRPTPATLGGLPLPGHDPEVSDTDSPAAEASKATPLLESALPRPINDEQQS